MRRPHRKAIWLLLVGTAVAAPAFADGDDVEDLRRKTPSGQYVDPASFFRFHGYVSLSYSEVDDNLGGDLNGTPNILVNPAPGANGKNGGGFRNDAALFVGGEPFEGVGAVIEIHFVGDATDPVVTEAKMTWDLIEADDGPVTFRLVGGRFWWPFGIHNDEWFSALNNFSLLSPTATEVVPAHYNEVGLMGEGEVVLGNGLGLNYVAAIGNGVPGFAMGPNVRGTTADVNDNRTLTGRVGLVRLGGIDAELGLSFASGDLAEPGSFTALGSDLVLGLGSASLRSYLYSSTEDTGPVDIDRSGFTVEPMYTISLEKERLSALSLLVRYSQAEEDDPTGTLTRSQLGVGVVGQITSSLRFRAGFMSQGEDDDLPDADNNAITFSITNEF